MNLNCRSCRTSFSRKRRGNHNNNNNNNNQFDIYSRKPSTYHAFSIHSFVRVRMRFGCRQFICNNSHHKSAMSLRYEVAQQPIMIQHLVHRKRELELLRGKSKDNQSLKLFRNLLEVNGRHCTKLRQSETMLLCLKNFNSTITSPVEPKWC